jgi:hypothetical protein
VCGWCGRYIQSTCATSGEGLYEGLDWLSSNIANKVSGTGCVGGAPSVAPSKSEYVSNLMMRSGV